jgi:flagellar basal body-associated protein FliL
MKKISGVKGGPKGGTTKVASKNGAQSGFKGGSKNGVKNGSKSGPKSEVKSGVRGRARRLAVAIVSLIIMLSVVVGSGIVFREEITALFRGNDGVSTTPKNNGGNIAPANPKNIQVTELAYSTDTTTLTDIGTKKLIPSGIATPGANEVPKFVYGFQITWNGLTSGNKINAPVSNLKVAGATTYADQFTIKYAFGTSKPVVSAITATTSQYTVTTADGTVYLYVSIEFKNANSSITNAMALAVSGGLITFDIATSIAS